MSIIAKIHNDDFDFVKEAPRDAQLAFRGIPSRVLLRPGDRLYRFLSMPDLARKTFPGSELFKSPWWVPALTFNALTHTASKTGANLSDTARSRLAVTKEFSPTMDKIVIVEVKESVYGWIGPATHQPATGGDRSVLLLGNFQQLYIPNLASDSRGLTSKVGMLIYHGMVQ